MLQQTHLHFLNQIDTSTYSRSLKPGGPFEEIKDQEAMRDRMERLVAFPFSAGCISHTSVAVVGLEQQQQQQPRRSSKPALHDTKPPTTRTGEDDQESLSSRPNISTGFHRLFKNISNLFEYYKDEMEDDDEVEMEIEIGFPMDVKHVTHIGFDGSAPMNMKSHQTQDHELLSLPAAIHG